MVALRINTKVNIKPKDMSSVQDLTNAKASIPIPKQIVSNTVTNKHKYTTYISNRSIACELLNDFLLSRVPLRHRSVQPNEEFTKTNSIVSNQVLR